MEGGGTDGSDLPSEMSCRDVDLKSEISVALSCHIRKSEKNCTVERLIRAARSAAPRWYALPSLQTRLLAVFYALGTGYRFAGADR